MWFNFSHNGSIVDRGFGTMDEAIDYAHATGYRILIVDSSCRDDPCDADVLLNKIAMMSFLLTDTEG